MKADSDVVATPVAIVLRMQRLVRVADKMDQEAQRLGTGPVAEPAIGQKACVFFDLRDHAVPLGTVAARLIASSFQRNIDIMPGAGFAAAVPDLVCPIGVMDHHHRASQ